jgi:hypothetical protein
MPRPAAVGVALALVLAGDVAVAARRHDAGPAPVEARTAGDVLQAGVFARAGWVPAAADAPDTDPCRTGPLLALGPPPVESVVRAYEQPRAFPLLTVHVARWASAADAALAYGAVRDGLRRCTDYDVTAPNGSVLVYAYTRADDVARLGDAAVHVSAEGGHAGGGTNDHAEEAYVVRSGRWVLDVRLASFVDPGLDAVARCWASALARLASGRDAGAPCGVARA